MTAYSSSEARDMFPELIKKAKYTGERFRVTIRGKKVAAIISEEDLLALEAYEDMLDVKEAEKTRQEIKKHGTLSWKDAKEELDL